MSRDAAWAVELRRYALHPDQREALIELFDREFVETQEAAGMEILGQFRDLDDPDSFVWLRGFSDMGSRQRSLEAFYSGPVWKAHAAAANATMVNVDNILLLRPLSGLKLDTDRRASRASRARPPGLLAVTIYPLSTASAGEFPAFFSRELQPTLRQTDCSVVATYVTEHSENTFPALPVRAAEVFVWMAMFADEADHAAHMAALQQLPVWRDGLSHELKERLGGRGGIRAASMERLWSPAGATSGKHRQIAPAAKPLKQAKSVAVGCNWLPRASNGKEGVDGSSPSEGRKRKIPGKRGFLLSSTAPQSTSAHRRDGHSARHAAAKPCKSSCCPVPRSTSLGRRGSAVE